MLHPLKNQEVLQAIAQHDERAFNTIFQEYHQPLAAFVFAVTRSKELTEEIIQDVFVKIWEERAALPTVKNFSAYLFIITRNHTLNTIRKQQQVKKKEDALNHHYTIIKEEEIPADDYYARLDSAVEQLPLQQKKVFLLKQQGLKNADVAFQMDISVNTVKKYQQWALQAIARFIKAGSFTGPLILYFTFF